MKKHFNLFTLVLMIFTILSLGQNAQAQYKYNYSSNIWVNSGMNLLFQKRWATARIRAAGKTQLADALEGRRSNNNQKTPAQTAAAPTENILRRVPLSETSFESSSREMMPELLAAELVNVEPEESQRLIKASNELLRNYEEMLMMNKEAPLKNNVAGAAAFALIMSRSILTDGKKDLSEKQSEALLQDINALLASSDKFRKLPNIEKQKMYEMFVISSGFAAMLYQQGTEENNAKKTAQGKDLAKTILSQFFDRPLDEIEFTNDGVEFQ
ncbi:MAG TPA: DUF6683 family protein [Pyrinomonadaceae bacterium]|nr:DUF6683 family protein [Pyrinomonadaceae bacterium]